MGRYVQYGTDATVSMESLASSAVSDDMVKQAEKALGLKFDSALVAYLKNPITESDDAEFEYVGLTGNHYLNTVTATEGFRGGVNEGLPPFPNDGVVLGHIGNGDCYFWSIGKKRVGYYSHDDDELEWPNLSYLKSLDAFAANFFK